MLIMLIKEDEGLKGKFRLVPSDGRQMPRLTVPTQLTTCLGCVLQSQNPPQFLFFPGVSM
jgi:hypothetical protein